MKKLISIIAIAAIAITSTFATVTPTITSFSSKGGTAPEMYVTLASSLLPTSYSLSLLYGIDADVINLSTTNINTIDGFDLTKEGYTNYFYVMISKGNLNKNITFITKISENPFVGIVDGVEYTTKNDFKVVSAVNGVTFNQYFKKTINAGPQAPQSIATFYFDWIADKTLPAGEYTTTNTINISVN